MPSEREERLEVENSEYRDQLAMYYRQQIISGTRRRL